MIPTAGPESDGGHDEELARLRRRLVADGYSTPHSCQHCEELTISLYNRNDRQRGPDTPTVVSKEKLRQYIANGCRLWSLVLDEIDYEILKNKKRKRASPTSSTFEDVALRNNEARELESLSRRCLSRITHCVSQNTRSTSAEACADHVELWLSFNDLSGPPYLTMNIRAYENGLEYSVQVGFTVFELPRSLQISNHRYAFAWPANVDPGSAQSFQLMRTWTQKCALEHGCGISDHYPSCMPTMLLSVDRVDKCGSIILVEITPGEKHQYLALSYCWGPKAQKKILTRATRAEFVRDGIRLEDLDATVQDAIRVTTELGYVYIWIDALCIIQDDYDFKAGELGRMDDIYESASITIVASRASSVSEGFLTQRQPAGASTPDKTFKMTYERPDKQQSTAEDWVVFMPKDDRNWESPNEPWESRAWTLQEDLLSRRQLRFGTKQTRWVCHCSQKPYEDFDGWFWADLEFERGRRKYSEQPAVGSLGRVLQQPDLVESVDEARKDWYSLVHNYSHRSLSFQEDRLPAISAVSRRMARILGDEDEYWCGMWKSNAPWELLWAADKTGDATKTQEASNHGRGNPTWTWASQKGGVFFQPQPPNETRIDVHFGIVEHLVEYRSQEHIYGAVKTAQLRARGLVTTAPFGLHELQLLEQRDRAKSLQLERDETTLSERGAEKSLKLRRIFLDKGLLDLDRSATDLLADPSRAIHNKQIVLLLVSYNRLFSLMSLVTKGLVLLNEGGNQFSRLGIFSIWDIGVDESDYYGGDFATEDGYAQTFLAFWGGLDSIQEILVV